MELPVEIQMEYNAENGSLEVDFAGEDMGILIGNADRHWIPFSI